MEIGTFRVFGCSCGEKEREREEKQQLMLSLVAERSGILPHLSYCPCFSFCSTLRVDIFSPYFLDAYVLLGSWVWDWRGDNVNFSCSEEAWRFGVRFGWLGLGIASLRSSSSRAFATGGNETGLFFWGPLLYVWGPHNRWKIPAVGLFPSCNCRCMEVFITKYWVWLGKVNHDVRSIEGYWMCMM